MPRLSLGLGVSSSSKLPSAAAPSGIPVASTASVVIAGQNATVPNGTYAKVTANGTRVAGSAVSDKLLLDTGLVYLKEAGADVIDGVTLAYGQILVPPNTTFTSTYGAAVSPEPFWRAGVVRANYSEDDPYFYFAFLTISTNSSTDPTTIPTTGWSPSITITAAPSGIPVASTASVTVAGFAGFSSIYDGTYAKQSTGYSFSSEYAYEITITGVSYVFVVNSATKVILLPPGSSIFVNAGIESTTIIASGTWRIGNISSYEEENISYHLEPPDYNPATNASSNNNYIPTAGWSPSITITAA